jgi:6-pyruvoyltetrahydropterin/6-carboxytetrahydropterin synthase
MVARVGENRRVRLVREFRFEAAHRLPKVADGHKCARLHGHGYRVELTCEGEVGESTGWLVDFADIKRAFAPCLKQLDHQYLNDVEGLENPTAEILAMWIRSTLQRPALPDASIGAEATRASPAGRRWRIGRRRPT